LRTRVCTVAEAVVQCAAALQGGHAGSCAWGERDTAAIAWLSDAARSMQALAAIDNGDEGIDMMAAAVEHAKANEAASAAYEASRRAQELFQQLGQPDISTALRKQAAAIGKLRGE
jgi:hypothetical protein